MPKSYVYQGLSKDQKEKLMKSAMAPLEDDYSPHRHFGGFPDSAGGNPSIYYPDDRDKPKQLADKEKNRDAYRKVRRKEMDAKIAKMDAEKVIGGIVFPKGEEIIIPDDNALLLPTVVRLGRGETYTRPPKMEALLKSGTFVEGKGAGKKGKVAKIPTKEASLEQRLEKEVLGGLK